MSAPRRPTRLPVVDDDRRSSGDPASDRPAAKVDLHPSRGARLLRRVVSARPIVQVTLSALVVALLWAHVLTLAQVIVIGVLLGVVLGKVFCRWACPMGLAMEKLMGAGGESQQQLYMYYKLGCPIAWASGFLNRFSLLRIRHDPARCIDCGKCDQACYIAAVDATHSHYRTGLARPGSAYSCSRCLACVKACPTASVSFGVKGAGA